jgi:hypothetical protein
MEGNGIDKRNNGEDKKRLLGRDLNEAKGSLMSLGWVLMLSQDPPLVASAHQLVAEAEEAIHIEHQAVRAALRKMGAASDISDAGSVDMPAPGNRFTSSGVAQGRVASSSLAPPRWRSQASSEQGSEMADLIRYLSGAQANDSGWPTFKGKYVEYPRFKKEWWAYRRTYHWHVRDELVCRAL